MIPKNFQVFSHVRTIHAIPTEIPQKMTPFNTSDIMHFSLHFHHDLGDGGLSGFGLNTDESENGPSILFQNNRNDHVKSVILWRH